jgi:hypothetical protein
MAYPSVTYSFTNGTTISATEVNQNFTDLINGLSDGTKDLNISALTASGTTNLNGAVNLGNATSDDVTVTGYVAATVNPKTANSFDLGGSSQTWRSGYFATSVLTPLIKAIDGNGIKFQENGGTEVMSISDAGAVTAGVAVTNNKNGQIHRISGSIYSSNVTSTAQSGRFFISCNARNGADNAENGRTDSTTGGCGIILNNNTSDTNNCLEIIANQASDATNVSGDAIATATQVGAWTFPVSISVTGTADVSGTSAALRTDGGCYVAKIMSAGTVTDRTPFPEDLQTAIDAVNSMEKLPEGEYDSENKEKQLDHSKLHPYLRSGDHRDLSATVSCLVVYCRELSAQVTSLQAEVAALKAK